ncbi:MAG: rhodanese-like domain-containing protein, partial [Planctomycetota bacterium]|nr:rhodanese-like domain-containing protein [Planctomycetota bacterium]
GARPDALSILDPGSKIVIYCAGGDCHASHDVAIRLNALGFKSCYVLKEGFPAWQAAGYEVVGGAP